MDKWELFLDAEKLWRWRRVSDNAQQVLNSTRSFPSRRQAIVDAAANGYTEAGEVDAEDTFANLEALRKDK
jgi:hypothetical protein